MLHIWITAGQMEGIEMCVVVTHVFALKFKALENIPTLPCTSFIELHLILSIRTMDEAFVFLLECFEERSSISKNF